MIRKRWFLAPVLALSLGSLLAVASARAAAPATQKTSTTSYDLELYVEPAIAMLAPADLFRGQSGDVMVQEAWLPMPVMDVLDRMHNVNHHVELRVTDKASKSAVSKLTPKIQIMNEATSDSHWLPDLGLMYDSSIGTSDLHWGQNAWLSDGKYTFVISVGNESLEFDHVAVSDGATLPNSGITR